MPNVGERVSIKNSFFSLKGIICIVAVVVALAGAITIWSVLDGQNSILTYHSSWLFLAAVLNLFGYVMNIPIIFCFTATIYFAGFPTLLTTGEGARRAPTKTNNTRAILAGVIIELIGVTLSFFGVPFSGLSWATIIDVVILIVVAVFDVIGGALYAELGRTVDAGYITTSDQIYIILAIFALAVLFGSRSLYYCSLVLSTIMFMSVLPSAFFKPNNSAGRKLVAAATLTFIGMLITAVWTIITVHIFREEEDRWEGDAAQDTEAK